MTNKAILENENGTSTQDDSQETNSDSQEAGCGPARTKHDGDSGDEPDTDERPSFGYVVVYKAIEWSPARETEGSQAHGLTINLALWWLHMMAATNRSLQDHYPALGEEQHTREIELESAAQTTRKMPTRSSKRKRSPPIPVSDTESTADGQRPESPKTGEKRVKWGPNRGR